MAPDKDDKALHVLRLQRISDKIVAAERDYRAREADEDDVIKMYDRGLCDLRHLESVAAKRRSAWAAYKALLDEGERLLAAGRKG